jgi:hypothetical protein
LKRITLALVALLAFSSQSFAHSRHHHHHRTHVVTSKCFFLCPQASQARHRARISLSMPIRHQMPIVHKRRPLARVYYASRQELPHPVGCPHTAFCGCGASIEAFGHTVRSLWLASNWYRFPRTSAAPGMAIVRPHHVAILKEHVQGNVWMVIDHNGGGHRSWLHPRSIAGYTVVDPHGGSVTMVSHAHHRSHSRHLSLEPTASSDQVVAWRHTRPRFLI